MIIIQELQIQDTVEAIKADSIQNDFILITPKIESDFQVYFHN